MNGHYQSGGISIPLLNGMLSENTADNWFGLWVERGSALKLCFRGYSIAGQSQYMISQFANDQYIPLMIIPHAKITFTPHCVIDIADLVNHQFNCSHNIILENRVLTATTQAGGTFTFNALCVRILKTDMLTTRYRYYLRDFDIEFPDITGLGIEAGADKNFIYESAQCFVGTLAQQQGTGYYEFNIDYQEQFKTTVNCDVSDYAVSENYGSINMGLFGNKYTAVVPLTPFLKSTKIQNGGLMTPYFNASPRFSFSAISGISDNGIEGHFSNGVASPYTFINSISCSDFSITPQKLSNDLFKIAIIDTGTTSTAQYNTWSWQAT